MTVYVQSSGLSGRDATVEIFSRSEDEGPESAVLEKTELVPLGADGEVVTVKFELKVEIPGRRVLTATVSPPPGVDSKEKDLKDEKVVDVVDQKTKVLLLAGGPMREYRFVRNQLRRDESMVVDVLLQSAQPGVSQDANKLLGRVSRRQRRTVRVRLHHRLRPGLARTGRVAD